MISGVNRLPRASRTSQETRKNRASVSNINPSKSNTTARIVMLLLVPRHCVGHPVLAGSFAEFNKSRAAMPVFPDRHRRAQASLYSAQEKPLATASDGRE